MSTTPPRDAADALGGRRVLVVSPDEKLRDQARRILNEAGVRVGEAADAIEGLRELSSHADDVLFCSVELPFFDAADLVRKARRLPAGERLRAIAHGASSDRQRCLAAGFDAYVADPVDWAGLPSVLAGVVTTSRESLAREQAAASMSSTTPPPTRLDRDQAGLHDELDRVRSLAAHRAGFLEKSAHELSVPLTPLVGYIGMLRGGRLGALSEQQTKAVDALSQSVGKLERGIEEMVDFCALESGKYLVHREPVAAQDLVKAVEADAHVRARTKHVKVELRVDPALSVGVDRRRMKQALAALLDHGLEQSPHGGHLLFEVSVADGRATFAVYDQGPVVTDAQKLLTAYAQRATDKPSAPGLAVARKIAEAHGGTLWIESPPHDQPEVRDLFPGSKVALAIPVG